MIQGAGPGARGGLVPRPRGPSLVGRDLWRYLIEQRVTALCCVPTLLATIEGKEVSATT